MAVNRWLCHHQRTKQMDGAEVVSKSRAGCKARVSVVEVEMSTAAVLGLAAAAYCTKISRLGGVNPNVIA
jgi:hypothetical protein